MFARFGLSARLLAASALYFVAASTSVRAAAAQPTLDDIAAGLQAIENGFFQAQSMRLRFERPAVEVLLPKSLASGELPCEWTVAYGDKRWFLEQRFTEPSKSKELWIPAEPQKWVIDDAFLLDWTESAKFAAITDFEGSRAVHSALQYTSNLSLDAPKYIAEASRHPDALDKMRRRFNSFVDLPFLPEFLRENRSKYRVRPQPESADGASCWIVEWPGMDAFAVDPDRGFAVVRRTYHFGPGEPPRVTIHNSDYRQVRPGLWLPYRQVVERYGDVRGDPRALWGKVVARETYLVRELEFDSIGDDQFAVQLPPGTKVIDEVRGLTYKVGDANQADPFDFPVIESGRGPNRPGIHWWLWLNVGLVSLAVLAVLWKWWTSRGQ